MGDNTKEAAQRELDGPKGDRPFDEINCIALRSSMKLALIRQFSVFFAGLGAGMLVAAQVLGSVR